MLIIRSKGCEAPIRFEERCMRDDSAAIIPKTEDLAAAVVPIDVHAAQVRDGSAAVDIPADHHIAASGGILEYRRFKTALVTRALDAWSADRAFHDAPAVVVSLPDDVYLLPVILTHVSRVKQAGQRVERKPPWITEAIRPYLRPGFHLSHKGIIVRNAIRQRAVLLVHIDPKHLSQ